MIDPELEWRELCQRIGLVSAAAEGWDLLEQSYREPPRAYHNISHVEDCIAQLKDWELPLRESDSVRLAIFWHDAVYDSQAKHNEERSAKVWAEFARKFGFATDLVDRVIELIILTQHNAMACDSEGQLIQDIDLSILGRESSDFDRYESAIRQEYSWVLDEDYAKGRASFLDGILERERIFLTEHGFNAFESRARANIKRILKRLRI